MTNRSQPTSSRPNFFLIGAPKTGTTSLSSYLAAHPDIFVVPGKEPWFWSDDVVNPNPPHLHLHDEQQYLRLFPPESAQCRVRADASTSYLFSETALARILEFCPEAKFTAILRRPRDLVYSLYWEQRFAHAEPCRHFSDAWEQSRTRQPRDSSGRWSYNDYAWVASMGTHIERLFERVPPSQRLVLLFDDLITDPARVYRTQLDFLGLADDGRSSFPPLNEAKAVRSSWLSRGLNEFPRRAPGLFGLARKWAPKVGLQQARSRLVRKLSKPLAKPALDPDLAHAIDLYFDDEVSRLEDLLHRPLPTWHASREGCGIRSPLSGDDEASSVRP